MMGSRSILSLNNDILLLVCDVLRLKPPPLLEGQWRYHDPNPLAGLAALSATCRRLRDLACPQLFHQVKLGRNHWTWDDVRKALKLSPPTRHIQHFTLDIYVHHRDSTKPQANQELATSLARFLQTLEKLQVISFTIPEQCNDLFRETFEATGVQLTTVKTLATNYNTQWLVYHCPAVEVLSISALSAQSAYKFGGCPEVLSKTTNIRHLEVAARWNVDGLKAVRDKVPSLRVLAMLGGSQYGAAFETMIPVIRTLGDLEVLIVAPVGTLRMPGFRDPPVWECRGPDGAAKRARVAEEKMQVSEKLAFTVFGACAKLKEFWVSEFLKCTVTRNEDGSVSQVHLNKERRLKPTEVAK